VAESKTARPFVNPNPGHCRECGVELANKRFQYCTSHRPAHAPPQQRRAKAQRIAATAREKGTGRAVLEMVPGVGSAKGTDASTPTVADWDDGLGRLAVGLTWAVGLRVTRGEPRDVRGRMAVELAMTDDEALAVTHPIAARFAGTTLNRRHGRKILETLALSEPIVAVMQYADRLHEYRFERARREAGGAIPTGNPFPVGHRNNPFAPPYTPPAAAPAAATEEPHGHADAEPAATVPAAPITGWLGGPFGAA